MIKDEKYIKIISSPAAKPQEAVVAEGAVINNQDITITANGVYRADAGYTGIGTATVNVPQDATLVTKNITANGTYNASSDEADGYSSVTVNVPNSTETKTITQNGTYTPTAPNIGFSSVEVNVPTGSEPVINSLNITPATSAQIIPAPAGVDGFAPVSVAAVTAAIDSDIVASNIKSGVSILGVAGSVVELDGETVTITPSTSQQTITPTSPHNGITSATVSAVTSAIDSNIQAANIKKDVTILGVTGSYEGGGSAPTSFIAKKVSDNTLVTDGSYGFLNLNGATAIGAGGLAYAYSKAVFPNNTSIDLSAITSLGSNALYYCFNDASGISEVDLSGLTSISALESYCLDDAFARSSVQSVDLSNLKSVKTQCFRSAFWNCQNLTSINFQSLEEITSGQCCSSMCYGATSLVTISFPSLNSIPALQVFGMAFANCSSLTSVSFPALTSNSFGTYTNQFYSMLNGVTGCTVHFPSNLQSVIGSWSDVVGGFSGTNTVVLFDLPATE